MPYSLNLDKLLALRSCQHEFQIGDSYDCWSKIAVAVLEESFIADAGISSIGAGTMNPRAVDLFKEIYAKVGRDWWYEAMKINDSGEHMTALMLCVHLVCLTGLAEVVDV